MAEGLKAIRVLVLRRRMEIGTDMDLVVGSFSLDGDGERLNEVKGIQERKIYTPHSTRNSNTSSSQTSRRSHNRSPSKYRSRHSVIDL
jgi:hypothetical protein